MNFFTLNEVLWAALIVGIIMNWSIEKWVFNIKEVVGNIAFVALVWAVTQYLIVNEPQEVIAYRVIYVIVACIVAFSPVEIFKAIKSGGKEGIITWFYKQRDKYSKKEEIETTVKETKTTEIDNGKV